MIDKNVVDYVFNRDRFWFHQEKDYNEHHPRAELIILSLTEAFEDGVNFFSKFSDSSIQAGLMFLVSSDGISEALVSGNIDLKLITKYFLSHISMFRDVVAKRSNDPSSPLNEVCYFYFDSFFEYCVINPSEIEKTELFPTIHKTMYQLFGINPSLDEGIHRAFLRWFPHLLSK